MEFTIRDLIYTSLCMVLGVAMPFVFHVLGLGTAFSPMHFVVLLCGLGFGPVSGLICGFFCPYLSSIITGVPPIFPYTICYMVECATYGFLSGLLYRGYNQNIYVSLIGSILVGRIVGGLTSLLLLGSQEFTFATFLSEYFVAPVPGTILDLLLLPVFIYAMKRLNIVQNID